MQQLSDDIIIYGAGGLALLFYAAMAWKVGRIGLGNRFLRFGRPGHVEKATQPRRFRLILGLYVLAGCFLLGVAVFAWLD